MWLMSWESEVWLHCRLVRWMWMPFFIFCVLFLLLRVAETVQVVSWFIFFSFHKSETASVGVTDNPNTRVLSVRFVSALTWAVLLLLNLAFHNYLSNEGQISSVHQLLVWTRLLCQVLFPSRLLTWLFVIPFIWMYLRNLCVSVAVALRDTLWSSFDVN